MSPPQPSLDLVVLVPGRNEQSAIDALLSDRLESLGIHRVTHRILVHPRSDPGCFLEAPDVLQPFVQQSRFALVILDHEGSGRESDDPSDMAVRLKERLEGKGWRDRAAVLVIVPELDVWVWSDSPEVDAALGWQGQDPSLRDWLEAQGFWGKDEGKPSNPKGAVEAALREVRIPRSSSVYEALAKSVSLSRCKDPSFAELKRILRAWFGR